MDRRGFIADDGWFFIAVITLPVTSLLGIAGFPTLAGASVIIGWLLLTPLLLFWGEDLAEWYFGPAEAHSESDRDPIEELKHRYAAGEITEEEFERRLTHLLETDRPLEKEST